MIQPFTKGNPDAVRKMNEIIDAVNNLARMTGDGFVNVKHGINGGTTFSLSMNELKARMMNFGEGDIHKAYAKAAAGAGSTIVCFLGSDSEDPDDEITVNCEIVGGSDLNSALPRLEDGTRITVWNDGGTWRNAGNPFQASGPC